jgi:hypothetical protein
VFGLVALLAVAGGCRNAAPAAVPASPAVLGAGALLPSSRMIMGRVIAVESARGVAVVELAADAPKSALVAGTDLVARTADLRETAHLEVSPFLRSRTLGTKIVAGQPSPGDEVVWVAP